MPALTGEDVARYVSEYVKVNPAGVDIAPKKIYRIPENVDAVLDGRIRGFTRGEEVTWDVYEEIAPKNGYWVLEPGIYVVAFPKVVVPKDVVGFAYPRSTLNRLGLVKVQTAVFDPGYEGEFTQTWLVPIRARIRVGEAWVQLVYIRLEREAKEGYNGYWQGEMH
ncbi:MAG: dCTP deaminase [Candidatus Diapherotrites archaeon]|nr:dCTP deaminase [Candidatus Diapherotrites archaeon]MDN5367104.1 dCTP deaminase [Candidatus Diapherotrites archaeon]